MRTRLSPVTRDPRTRSDVSGTPSPNSDIPAPRMTDRSSCGRHSGMTSKLLTKARQRVDQSSCRLQRPPDRRLRQVRSFRLLKGSLIRSRQLKEAPPRWVWWTRTPPKCLVARDHPRQRWGQVSTSLPLGPPVRRPGPYGPGLRRRRAPVRGRAATAAGATSPRCSTAVMSLRRGRCGGHAGVRGALHRRERGFRRMTLPR